MPTFEYQVEVADGAVVNGKAIGASLDQVASDLAAKGMVVRHIAIVQTIGDPLATPTPVPQREVPRQEAGAPQQGVPQVAPPTEQRSYVATSVVGPLVGKVSLTELAFFFRQLATMLEAAVPYVQSLDTLSKQTKSLTLRPILAEFKGHVEAGRPISTGMERYPEVFTPVMLSLVKAGERGGFLDDALTMVANYLDQEIKLRNLYKRVTFYPKLQVAASIVIILAANMIIASLHGPFSLTSPLTTPATWVWLTPLLILLFLFFRVGLANNSVKFQWDMVTSNIPYIGNTLRQLAMAKFGRAFGALYRGGVPIPECLVLSAEACGNQWLRTLMVPAARKLEAGESIGMTFRETGAFSPIVLDMVDTGERTGNLDHMLNKMADFYEDEAATRSTQTAMITGVIIGLFVAAYIGYIVITFYGGVGSFYQDQMK